LKEEIFAVGDQPYGVASLLDLSFSTEFIQFLFEHRSRWLLPFAKLMSLFGEVEGYVIVVALIYTCFDKTLAFRVAVIALLAMTLNHFLKTMIGNPRPFVADGSYPEKWAVSGENMRELASESSTPSGHAMSVAAFYVFLIKSVQNLQVRQLAVVLIILVGLSRPYLGVHYLEDIFLGWAIGIGFALLAYRYQTRFIKFWEKFDGTGQALIVAAASLATYLVTLWSNDGVTKEQPLLFVEYLGFLTGILAARSFEMRLLNFDPNKGNLNIKVARFCLTVMLIMAPILILEYLLEGLVSSQSTLGHFLKYITYALAGFSGIFLAPAIFMKIGWAHRSTK
jgi:membrane-associated phospholipid phosphatase